MKRKRQPLSDQLRRAIDESGLSRYRVCMETGILQSTMSRFMRRQCCLSQQSIDAVADLLELDLLSRKGESK